MTKEKYLYINQNKVKPSLSVLVASHLRRTIRSPDEILGGLFYDVQKSHIYSDSKTFADLVPKYRIKKIQKEYLLAKNNSQFDLLGFVDQYFYNLESENLAHEAVLSNTPREYINILWSKLRREYHQDKGSLISLPHAYIVPGGRFTEQFYWDSYFIMLGLAADGRWDDIEGMIKNITYMIRKFGFVPTANRTYLLSRSQPPFLSVMLELLAKHNGYKVMIEYLPYLVLEYEFWMTGGDKLEGSGKSFAHVVKMPNGALLNRYYDSKITPRPESFNEDIQTVGGAHKDQINNLYSNLRAGAESGWDFSSRWFNDPQDIRTICAIDIIPIDLNCLLYQLEQSIAKTYELINKPIIANKFQKMAECRMHAIREYCWDENEGFFVDYNFRTNKTTGRLTLASVFPLYSRIATNSQAKLVSERLEKDFLKKGGLVTTLIETGQQWDSPNGWAPLQWIAIQGLRNYGYNRLANEIKSRWIKTNLKFLDKEGRLVEKYNVYNPTQAAEGGEYVLQDGFGWTNGVLAALMQE